MTPDKPGMQKVVVVTHIITPYQVELFDALRSHGAIDLKVVYLAETAAHRQWARHTLHHPYIDLSLSGAQAEAQASGWIADAEVCVFGYYRHPVALRWIQERARSGKPWCFWGERPGFRVRGEPGKYYRQWRLAQLNDSAAPIWGIGQWAIDGYKLEFGGRRQYFNIPYFSNLDRFRPRGLRARSGKDGVRRLLFSGSLIERKGVDLLARAFRELVRGNGRVQLDFVGDGPLRNRLMRELSPVSGNVTFHGFRQWADLPEYYAQADILCVPSRYDGWGLVVPEGLAAGLPVIATDRMGAAIDLLHDGVNGWLVGAGDQDSLRLTLARALALSDQELERMSAAAADSVAPHSLADGVRRFENAVAGTLNSWNTQATGD